MTYTTAELNNIIAKADAYIARVPYTVREFRSDGTVCTLWDGTLENCKWWMHESDTMRDVDADTVAVVPNSRYDALCALGYGFDLCVGNIPESLYR